MSTEGKEAKEDLRLLRGKRGTQEHDITCILPTEYWINVTINRIYLNGDEMKINLAQTEVEFHLNETLQQMNLIEAKYVRHSE